MKLVSKSHRPSVSPLWIAFAVVMPKSLNGDGYGVKTVFAKNWTENAASYAVTLYREFIEEL